MRKIEREILIGYYNEFNDSLRVGDFLESAKIGDILYRYMFRLYKKETDSSERAVLLSDLNVLTKQSLKTREKIIKGQLNSGGLDLDF